MARNGKIARLPREIREQLNRRLDNGEPGIRLVEWLNGTSEVQSVLAAEFGGRAVTKQNLSAWRLDGYKDWLRHEDALERVRRLTEHSDGLDAAADGLEISDRLACVLATELTCLSEPLLQSTEDPKERWQQLRELLRELAQLRNEDHKALRLAMERERWDMEADQLRIEEAHRELKEAKDRVCAPVWARLKLGPVAAAFGGGEIGEKVAAFLLETQYILPPGSLSGKQGDIQTESIPVKPGQDASSQVQPTPAA